MAFKPRRLISFTEMKSALIANSQTIAIGDLVIPGATSHAGAVTGAANTTVAILGVVTSIVGANGQVLEKGSVTVASNNETVGMIGVQYVPTTVNTEWIADTTAATGTTTNSNLPGMFTVDTATNGLILESSYAAYTSVKQFFSYGANSLNSSQVIGHFTPAVGQM